MKKKNKRIKELESHLQHALKTVHSGMVAIEALKKDATFDTDTAQNMCRNRDDEIKKLSNVIKTNDLFGREQKEAIDEYKATNLGLEMEIIDIERELTEANNKIADMQYAENIIVEFVQKTVGIA